MAILLFPAGSVSISSVQLIQFYVDVFVDIRIHDDLTVFLKLFSETNLLPNSKLAHTNSYETNI